MNPRHPDAVANLETCHARAQGFHHSHHLVAGRQRQVRQGQLAFDRVQVGMTNTARPHRQQNLARAWLWLRQFGHHERVILIHRPGRQQLHG